ncbi:hypothetical protein SY88_08370 [Clostridiales bacterium PH28_bin88]|nr:hypothetical protein SY88_08370 [Clostridiales bacterium PH28_bin88]
MLKRVEAELLFEVYIHELYLAAQSAAGGQHDHSGGGQDNHAADAQHGHAVEGHDSHTAVDQHGNADHEDAAEENHGHVKAGQVEVYLNGQRLALYVPAQVVNNRVLVPMRKIFEALGAKVQWNKGDRSVVGKKGDKTIGLKIGDPVVEVNGAKINLGTPPCNQKRLHPGTPPGHL